MRVPVSKSTGTRCFCNSPYQADNNSSVPKEIHRVGTTVPTQWYKSFNTQKLTYHCAGTHPAAKTLQSAAETALSKSR